MDHFFRRILSFSAMCLLGACAQHHPAQTEKKIGMPNPASAYCVTQKGNLEMRKDAKGNVTGYCHLKNGTVVEEWAFFRENHSKT